MADIRDISKVASKWTGNTAKSADNYSAGVQDPKKDWGKNTAAAEGNYEAGVQGAIQRKSFGKGVKSAGTEGWQAGAVNKGVGRFADGVNKSGSNYADGFAPYHKVIKELTLPARGPKGSDQNYARVATVGKALHAKKISK
jgi:hypothetical protein